MSTFGTMRARVAREMKRGEITASSTAVADAIVSAIDLLKQHRFTFTEFHDEQITASGSTTYVPLTRMSVVAAKVDTIKVVISSRDYPLDEKSWSEIDAIDSGQWYGYPEFYAIQGDEIRLYPPPNQNMTLRIAGVKELSEVSAAATNGATNAWMTEGELLIRHTAKANLFRDELRNNAQADYFDVQAGRARRELQRKANDLAATGRVRVTRMV